MSSARLSRQLCLGRKTRGAVNESQVPQFTPTLLEYFYCDKICNTGKPGIAKTADSFDGASTYTTVNGFEEREAEESAQIGEIEDERERVRRCLDRISCRGGNREARLALSRAAQLWGSSR